MLPNSTLDRVSSAHWSRLWQRLGAGSDPLPWHARLVADYSEPTRHYHNLQHIAECLRELDSVLNLARQPDLLKVALWFHDAVYDSRAGDNEEASARLAAACLGSVGIEAATLATVERLILATKTHADTHDFDTTLLIDIDLAILGQPAARFWAYETAIRAEYAWVPAPVFAEKRAGVLNHFLRRPALYRTDLFRRKYESAARENLRQAIDRLSQLPA